MDKIWLKGKDVMLWYILYERWCNEDDDLWMWKMSYEGDMKMMTFEGDEVWNEYESWYEDECDIAMMMKSVKVMLL